MIGRHRRHQVRGWGIGHVLAVALALIAAPSAGAATIPVDILTDTVADDGSCSLREAVTATNDDADVNGADDCDHDGGSGLDTITLGAGTHAVTGGEADDSNLTGDLDIVGGPGGLTIDGAGQDATVIGAAGTDRILHHLSGLGPFRISDLTLTGGNTSTGGGGAVSYSDPDLTLSAVTVRQNTSTFGGGIRSNSPAASLTIENGSLITNNTASESGGGIHAIGGLEITDSSVTLNDATAEFGDGGGILSGSSTGITNSHIDDNEAVGTSSRGGGIAVVSGFGGTPNLDMSGSTVTGNDSGDQGGGVYFNTGPDSAMEITGSSVSENTAVGNGGGVFFVSESAGFIFDSLVSGNEAGLDGGGVHTSTFGPEMAIQNATLSGNTAAGSGGGLYTFYPTELYFVTIAGNSASAGPAIAAPGGADHVQLKAVAIAQGTTPCDGGPTGFASGGFNVNQGSGIGGSCDLVVGTDLNSTDPQLGPLAANGGATMTRAIAPASQARDHVPGGSCTGWSEPLGQDQRGFPRAFPAGGSCDTGAYELNRVCLGQGVTTLAGSGSANTIAGTGGPDVIDAGAGDDTVTGLGGSDRICGGPGVDTASFAGGGAVVASTTAASGQGSDQLGGIERLTGSSFADTLTGDALANQLLGGAGDDSLLGLGGRDTARGGAGNDIARGGAGGDAIFGDAGRDRLFGDGGRDRLNGGAGKPDRCNGGRGRDRRRAPGCERRRKLP